MRAYLKLLNFEMNRFAKLYAWLAGIIFVIQISTTVIVSKIFMGNVADMMRDGAGQGDVLEMYGPISLYDVTMSMGFFGPIAIGIAGLLFYMFFIWYRDWFAKTTFIYRLLTLPTARMNIFFAKITTIMLSVFGLIAMQLIVLKLCSYIVKWIIPVTYRGSISVVEAVYSSYYLDIFLPAGLPEFFMYYGIGLSFVVVIFTMILFERSFRIKGLFLAAGYAVLCIVVCLFPVFLQLIFDLYLYKSELFFVELVIFILVTIISLWISRYLLNNKVTV